MGQLTPKSEKELIKLRKSFIEFYKQVGDVTLTCKTFGVSRPTFYKWYKRYDPANPQTLIDESKAPKSRRKSQMEEPSTTHSAHAKPDTSLPSHRYQEQNVLQQPQQTFQHPTWNAETQPATTAYPSIQPSAQPKPFQHPLAAVFSSVGGQQPQPAQSAPILQQPDINQPVPQSTPQHTNYPTVSTLLKQRMEHTHHHADTSIPPITFEQKKPDQNEIGQSSYASEEERNVFSANEVQTGYVQNAVKQHHAPQNKPSQPTHPSSGEYMRDAQPLSQGKQAAETQIHRETHAFSHTIDPIDSKRESVASKPRVHTVLKNIQMGMTKITGSRKFSGNKNGILFAGISIAIAVAVLPSLYFFNKSQSGKTGGSTTNETPATQDILAKVGTFMELPKDEEPTIATVTDLEKLKGQPFFTAAKKGDVVLIYDKAARIILYDPIANKIINAASTNIETPSPTQNPTTQKSSYRIGLLNGTDVTGLTRTVEKDLLEKLEKIEIASRDNAKKKGYEQTLVIDLSGTNKEMAASVATALRGAVSTLPEGEASPILPEGEAPLDILAIIGNGYVR